MVIIGTITELDTNAYAVNSVLYVASGGGFTATPPAANSQAVAIVERSNTNNGALIVKVNGLASNGGNGASDANKLVRFTSTGGASLTGGTLTDMTYAGSAAFTSTTRPTSAGTGTPGATSLITLGDTYMTSHKTSQVIPNLCDAAGANGGSSSANRGGWSMVTNTNATATSRLQWHLAQVSQSLASDIYTLDRRIIISFPITFGQGTPRSSSQLWFQVGRTVGTTTFSQLAARGFGFGISNDIVTPYVHDGSQLTNGTTFAFSSARLLVLDWTPSVGFFIYGATSPSTDLTLLSSVTTNLPTGNLGSWAEFLLYETASNTSIIRYNIGNIKVTLP
jgi:hypothetical protein